MTFARHGAQNRYRAEHYRDRAEHYGDRPEHYGDRPDRYDDRPEYYEERAEYYGDRPEYYDDRPEHYGDRAEYYDDRLERYDDRAEYYEERAERYPRTPVRRLRLSRDTMLAGIGIVVLANSLALGHHRLPFIGPAVGFWFLVVQPSYLIYTSSIWRASNALERIGYSVTATLLILMLGGLAINTVLPVLGVARPL